MGLRDIIGQDKAVRILLKTLERDRIPSSYLFAGEPGIGKKLTAVNLAKALNCLSESRGGRDSCDTCLSCQKIDRDIHPDFTMITPENGQIRIETIREIDEILSYKPFEGRYKIVIVDDAETLNQFAANAFLKTLEEPPDHSLIILITSNPERLPDTILSRCSRINFVPLAMQACKEVIRKEICRECRTEDKKKKTTQPNVSDAEIELLARLCMGRPGAAITEELIDQRNRFLTLFKTIGEHGKDAWSSREDMEKWFEYALALLRDMAVMKTGPGDVQLINPDIKEYLNKISMTTDLKVIIVLFQRLLTFRKHIHFNLNKSLTWNYIGSLVRKGFGGLDA